ncbi:SDR family NAD(P)-dependent oxidoreductase [Paenibacillus methanolicus]|uniref:NAD(P)-dependent dehydrogenase (Short-subunit alcohol dehydrogenase family) n=1 Tax=Paenibacillus methanolicus TaxID=582686 RepID=A0A5S5C1L0_9BACL|nr:glucose 1-dehydrogenase [Paenibacillus methanolicus]TYP73321.1 NAD(P)-dependent dehydrogenase (short-subunit alcohol dehydrogenase family) [Paenibacillus methanolicus]
MQRFNRKVVIVTGGASGIGAMTARLFAEEGASVVLADIAEDGQRLADEYRAAGLETSYLQVDVTKEDEVMQMVKDTVAKYGRLDILFANAGIASDGAADQIDFEEWQRVIDINLTGVFLSNKHAIQQMLAQNNGGAIVNCGSVHSFVGKARVAAYAAAKGGVKLFTQSSAVAYASKGIRINAVCPGYVETPLINHIPESAKQYLISLHPIGRLGMPIEVAKAVLFLASDDASYITGTSLMVDGGYTAV